MPSRKRLDDQRTREFSRALLEREENLGLTSDGESPQQDILV
jgi:hypothetical protein